MERPPLPLSLLLACALGVLPATAWSQTSLYLHAGGAMDVVSPSGGAESTVALTANGQKFSWSIPMPGWFGSMANFHPPQGDYTLHYYGSGTGGSAQAMLFFLAAPTPDCQNPVSTSGIGQAWLYDSQTAGADATWVNTTNSNQSGAAYLCLQLMVWTAPVAPGVTLRFDAITAPAMFTVPGGGTGPDGGTSDAGTGSSADGGPSGGIFDVGCDCSQGPRGLTWLALGLLAVARFASLKRRPASFTAMTC